jgi:hypothetical protein
MKRSSTRCVCDGLMERQGVDWVPKSGKLALIHDDFYEAM